MPLKPQRFTFERHETLPAHPGVLLLMTAAELQEHLCTLEERLLHPNPQTDRSELIPFLAEDFEEFCCSGRIMNRQQAIDALLTSTPRAATISFFYVTLLAPDVAHATYHATTALDTSYRSSLWVFRDDRWQIFFHQGTVAA